ncbi:hypothetical protein AB0L57_16230 [Nocardia sp. NPDC052254]|uniref:hypothetical protein n=1 Tax=Nocardia sp. NPDC052254 TaxID=3155681 RepID=UPI00342FD526
MTESWDSLHTRLAQAHQGEDPVESETTQPGVSPVPERSEVSPTNPQPGVTAVAPQPGVSHTLQPGVTAPQSHPGVTAPQDLAAVPAAAEHSEAANALPQLAAIGQDPPQNKAARQNPAAEPQQPGNTKSPDSGGTATPRATGEDPLQDRITQLHEATDLIDSALQHPLSAQKVIALAIRQALVPGLLPSSPESLQERATAESAAGRNILDQLASLATAEQQNLPAHWTAQPAASAIRVMQALTQHTADPAPNAHGVADSLSAWADGTEAAQNLDRRGHDQLLEAQRLLAAAPAESAGSAINVLLALADAMPKAQQGCNDRTRAAQSLSAHIAGTVSAFQDHTHNTEYLLHAFARDT